MYSETVLSEQRTLWRSAGGSAATIPADGCVDLIVRSEQVLLCGPQTHIIHAPADDVDPTVGLRLEAGTARRILPVALSELRDRVVELRTALGSEAAVLYDLMMRARIDPHPDLVLSELLVDQAEPWVAMAHRLARTGVPAREAARTLDWSERTLRRRMLEAFGYGYTTLARIERVFRARSLLRRGLSPAHVSATSGYADQPHLTREFVRMIGATPAQFSKAAKRSTLLPSGSSTVA
ncbi:AraC family transcriptional regulator [Actinomyces naeslundii]|uniref:AraC family transcriptional regulator n=1 Tax=Actinomyces naeslundii TaxID=1655 RepID=UPI00096E46E5|nr:helix-turn-helix domain-containing protein [Actinomyces naeslundii]OMG26660.1 DNA-binding protein [Actinomyces naeslundii]OMG35957.1 DNA-binding protein [Actinomyces naeslundii]